MDEECRRVSLRLYDVMNRVGVNDFMRQLYRQTSIRHEIQNTVTYHMEGVNVSTYRFGSSVEGTTTPCMGSDLDVVQCNERYPVIQDIKQATKGTCFLMVADEHTKPGYVKLQDVYDGVPLTKENCNLDRGVSMYDKGGRVCRKHFTTVGQVNSISERSGPADTVADEPGCVATDIVYAYRSRTFPAVAVEPLMECTRTGWLTADEVDKMINFGCLFVGVGHPASGEKDIEWRISFSFQERQLMFKLNHTQHVCYVLLKIIKNIVTSKPDVGKSLTSYHCKTCMFYAISKTTLDKWTPENLINCVFLCMHELLHCLRINSCPNFFVRKNNMLERRVTGQVKARLIQYIQDIIQDGLGVFYRIQSECIGDMLRGNMKKYDLDNALTLAGAVYFVHRNVYIGLGTKQLDVCKHLNSLSNKDAELFLRQQIHYLTAGSGITEHSMEDTKAALQELRPIFHKLYAQHLASQAFSTEVHETRHRLLRASIEHSKHDITGSPLSSRLVHVTILFRQGNVEMCLDHLQRLEQNLREEVETVCGCYGFNRKFNDKLVRQILARSLALHTSMESYMEICAVFSPVHMEIVPSALKFEFYRSFGAVPGSLRRHIDDWFDMAVVDSKVYLYFMQYFVYSHLNRHRDKLVAAENLKTVLQQDSNLGHRETGYNLLGWIYCQEGHIQTAAYCFLQSWRIRPHHNAAKWHMLVLIYETFVAGM